MDWNDFKIFLAIAHAGNLAGAAQLLDVNYSTVMRRINAFENQLGARLFDRFQSGYELTATGADMLTTVLKIESQLNELSSKFAGQDSRLSGVVRLATSETLASCFMAIFQEFLLMHPDVELEVLTGSNRENLASRQADIELRALPIPNGQLMAHKVCNIRACIFASHAYLKRNFAVTNLEDYDWIGLIDGPESETPVEYLSSFMPRNSKSCLRVPNGLLMRDAIKEGLGIGYLWCLLGNRESDLCHLREEEHRSVGLWLLIQKEKSKILRFSTFMEFFAEKVKQDQLPSTSTYVETETSY